MSERQCLPYITAQRGVSPDVVALAHVSLQRLPAAVVDALWRKRFGVYIRADFADWDTAEGAAKPYGHPNWSTCGGYWDESIGYAVVNAAWCHNQGRMDAVVVHEFGHALSINILGRPHRKATFRAAWKRGRDAIRQWFPTHYASKEGLGIYTIQWTRAVQETWAECFAWMLGARATTHPAFGDVFAECIATVSTDMEAIAT